MPYEKVVKNNYTDQDKTALVELISILKGLGRVMAQSSSLLSPIIRRGVHDYLQEFVHYHLHEMNRSAVKHKREIASHLQKLRQAAGDWPLQPMPTTLTKKDPKAPPTWKQRVVSPSPTLVYLLQHDFINIADIVSST